MTSSVATVAAKFAAAVLTIAVAHSAAAASEWKSKEDVFSRGSLFLENILKSYAPSPKVRSAWLKGPFTFPDNAQKDAGASRLNSIFGIDSNEWLADGEAFVRLAARPGETYRRNTFVKLPAQGAGQ